MTAKEHLRSVYEIERRIKRLEYRRQDLVNDLYGLRSISLDRDPVQTSQSGDRMLDAIVKKNEAEADMVHEIARLIEVKQKIMAEIETLPVEKHRQVLFDRYILCKRWEQIALEYEKDIRWIYRIHGDALAAFAKKYNFDH